MSYVPKEWIDSDKDFWSSKPAMPMKPMAMKDKMKDGMKSEMKDEKKEEKKP